MSLFETIRDRSIATPVATGTPKTSKRAAKRGDRSLILTRWLSPPADVTPGEVFRHRDADGRHEIATGVDMCDILDMPHVRYSLRIERPNFEPFEGGQRVMNLKSFRKHFAEQLDPDAL